MPCLSNCRGCSSQANAVCVTCGQGFYLNAQQVCQACTQYCLVCSSVGCSQCQVGYTLAPDFTCTLNCKPPCATCSSTSNTVCTSCLAGYLYDQTTNQCNPVTTCTGPCNVCPYAYVLTASQTCSQCTNANCSRCSLTNLNTCTSCYEGSYLNNGNCSPCPTGCSTCSNPSNCLSCSSGYTTQVQAISTSVNCVQCQSPCAQCIGNAQTCTKCATGYSLNGWKCVSNFNLGFSIVLGTTLQTFYANYA